MEMHDATTHPWHHPYYSLIKDIYNPFLYHNQYYCELTELELNNMLTERDTYVKITDSETGSIELTPTERGWVVYLRDCCLFEIHRRKYKPVLIDIIKLRFRNLKGTRKSRVSAYRKVAQWIKSNLATFKNGDYLVVTDNDPESQENHCSSCLDKTTQCPSESGSTESTDSEQDGSMDSNEDTQTEEDEADELKNITVEELTKNINVDEVTGNPLTLHWKWMVWPDYSRNSFGSAREDMPSTSAAHASTSTTPPETLMDPTSDIEIPFMNLLSLETDNDQQTNIVQ